MKKNKYSEKIILGTLVASNIALNVASSIGNAALEPNSLLVSTLGHCITLGY